MKPKRIEILGQEIKIKFRKVMKDCHGMFEYDKMLITLENKEGWEKVLFHECVHAAICISGFDSKMTPDDEEMLCVILENALSSKIRFV